MQSIHSAILVLLLLRCAVEASGPGPAGPRGKPGSRAPAIPRGIPGTSTQRQPTDVTTITISNTTVGLCKDKHFCSRLGCQPRADIPAQLCYCDPECVAFDDCCYDYPETCGTDQGAEEADFAGGSNTENEIENLSCISPYRRSNSYYLVTTCPADAPDAQTAVRCRDPHPDDGLSAVPSYSKISKKHFRNIHCALCNGENLADLVAWKIVVECRSESLSLRAVTLLQSSIRNLRRVESEFNCDVMMEFPEGDAEEVSPPRHCYPDVVHQCISPQHPLTDACESYTAYTTISRPYSGVYKNPHCALCNVPYGPDRLEYATDCQEELPVFYPNPPIGPFPPTAGPFPPTAGPELKPGRPGPEGQPGPGGEPGPGKQPGVIPPISILFDFRSDSSVRIERNRVVVVAERVQCPENEVYDPFSSDCRRLSCPEGYLLKENDCVPDFKALGQGCGDTGNSDIEMEVTVDVGELCRDNLTNVEDDPVGNIELCLEEFLGLDKGSLLVISSTPSPADATPGLTNNCTEGMQFSFSVNTTVNTTLMDFRSVSKLILPDSSHCQTIASRQTWSVKLHQNCKDLPKYKCPGIWLNDTEFSLPSENGTTLVYVNDSASWYALNQAIIRANFQKWENSFNQFTDVQICADPVLACPRVALNSSLFEEDENDPGSLIYIPMKNVFRMDEYIRTEDGQIEVCSFYEPNGTKNSTTTRRFLVFSRPQQVLSLIGNIISMVAAAITFITYCVFKELRKRISLAIMSLVACLFLAQLLLLISGSATRNPQACTAVAVLGHFFWLATVLWTGVLAFSLNRVFASISQIRRIDADLRVYGLQAIFAFGGATLIVLPCLIIHLCGCADLPFWYGSESVCWIGNGYVNLVTFGVPIGLTVLVNTVLFILTIHGMRASKKLTQSVTDKSELQKMREELFIYIRISSLMGFTWIFGFAAAFSDVTALWYIFIILNSCQGLLIFLSFICNKRVWHLWRNRLRRDSWKPSTSGPTTNTPLKPKSGNTLSLEATSHV
ncbi:uncharacterized protein LOC119724383 [Patiria miniata]|uniref:Uncharacterized protein n=1 Tax=Patiria miniata TaxID=46514 RepID=A0A913ZJ02_PATMI|nr:uncharacterized protein LOC119724383 [Patiria miniata]